MRPVTALRKLVVNLLRLGPFGLKSFRLNVAINSIELTDKSVNLFLLLPEGGLIGEDARLGLALIFLLLDGGLIIPPAIVVSWWWCHKEGPFERFISVGVGSGQGVAQIVLE